MAGFSTTLRNARADAIATVIGSGGKLKVYNGTQPATGGTATTLLATFTYSGAFAAAASAGVLTGNLPPDTTGAATGTATWMRITTSADVFVMDLTASTEFTMNSYAIATGVGCSVTGVTITEPNA